MQKSVKIPMTVLANLGQHTLVTGTAIIELQILA